MCLGATERDRLVAFFPTESVNRQVSRCVRVGVWVVAFTGRARRHMYLVCGGPSAVSVVLTAEFRPCLFVHLDM